MHARGAEDCLTLHPPRNEEPVEPAFVHQQIVHGAFRNETAPNQEFRNLYNAVSARKIFNYSQKGI